jgi:hypothetical protein
VKHGIYIWLLLLVICRNGLSQGFINLNFEEASLVPIPDGIYGASSIAVTDGLPGWVVSYGAVQQTQITFNNPALGSTFVNLWAANGQQLSGNYSVLLQGGLTASAASISQTAIVPSYAQFLLFYGAAGPLSATGLVVSLGGQDLSFLAISNGPNYTVYGVNISAFAGQTNTLMFSALEDFSGPNNWNIDNIQFSPSAIPEPGVLSLFGIGGLIFAWRRWKA